MYQVLLTSPPGLFSDLLRRTAFGPGDNAGVTWMSGSLEGEV